MSGRPPDLDELLGEGLPPAERERLRRAHEAMIAAGPPPELPPALERAPAPGDRAGLLPSRRRGAWLALAAALGVAAFGIGFLVGTDSGTQPAAAFETDFVLKMEGTPAAPEAVASLVVGRLDDDGNWPMELTVRGMPSHGRYELLLTRKGKLGPSCGIFVVDSDKAVVVLNAPYRLRRFSGWAITREGSHEILVRTSEI